MGKKYLGLDMGTNSIGWSVNYREDDTSKITHNGVVIFQEGVARKKNIERPAVQDRTNARASRRHYNRRRMRKINLLRILVEEGMCPQLTAEDLDNWMKHREYPLDKEFLEWQRTNESAGKNPYYDRYKSLTTTLDLSKESDRYTLGRALYHLSQRRGFLSNRKSGNDDESGKVKGGISELDKEIAAAGCQYLGEYFYTIYGKGKIRKHYTSRLGHYLKEFNAICDKQNIDEALRARLQNAIFYQRPLKSQKGTVGMCTFEKKSRCPISHPLYEEYRMLAFINNIKIQNKNTDEWRNLDPCEVDAIVPQFMRKSKANFDFEDIAKKIAGKGNYSFKGDKNTAPYHFNYRGNSTVSGCPVTAQLIDIFGENWIDYLCKNYKKGDGKTAYQIVNDVWHVLFSFDDDNLLAEWFKTNLGVSDEVAQKVVKITIPQGYASLSQKAISKILPYLRQGHRYDNAVFLANLKMVFPDDMREDAELMDQVERGAIEVLYDTPAPRDRDKGTTTKEYRLKEYLKDQCDEPIHTERLYHPSMIDVYSKAPIVDGIAQIGSPRTSALRNPMVMRSLFELRHLIKHLLNEKIIDTDTVVNIEMARELNTSNQRQAIQEYQKDRETENSNYSKEIIKLYKEATGFDIEPSETDILKYRLWEEQKHTCPYTGKTIGIADFLGANPKYDIEHTIPRSVGGDDSVMNNTLCDKKFNREVKKKLLPTQLSNYQDVMDRLEKFGWTEKIAKYEKQVQDFKRRAKTATTKEMHDSNRKKYLQAQMELKYWRGKYERFKMTEVPEGFSNRQGVDIGIISKYAMAYLKTVFPRIFEVKGETTSAFRQMWGLQEEYTKKERTSHTHHAIDAIVISCINSESYKKWAKYKEDADNYHLGLSDKKPHIAKPWETFTEDVKAIEKNILVTHSTHDNIQKKTKKKVRVRGKIRYTKDGKPMYTTGDAVRAALHKDTYYGAIQREGEVKYVIRKAIDQLKESDVSNIVDDVVRQKVQDAIKKHGFTDVKGGKVTVWMNKLKQIPINKVRLYATRITSPITLKAHRDLSPRKPHKNHYYVANDGNYCMAIYESTENKKSGKTSFLCISNIDVARAGDIKALIPEVDSKNRPLKCVLKRGTKVLFYENTPDELYNAGPEELAKRLYITVGMSAEKGRPVATISFKHHGEARQFTDLKIEKGLYRADEEQRPIIGISPNQATILVEGKDFKQLPSGEIEWIRKKSDNR